MNRVRDYLPDWLLLHSDPEVARSAGLTEILETRVESVDKALALVNAKIDEGISNAQGPLLKQWLGGIRPSNPSNAEPRGR